MNFPKEIPVVAGRTLIDAVRQGRYTDPEAVDAALWCLGCGNAYRGPALMGAAGDEKLRGPDGKSLNRASLPKLADAVEQGLDQAAGGVNAAAAGDGDEAGAFPAFLIPVLISLATKFLEKWLSKR